MLTFIIPVKSKQVSTDWYLFGQLFERTLKSVCNQTDSNFKVVVVCHEKPITMFTHSNIEYVYVDFNPPALANLDKSKQNKLREEDKARKILAGVEYCERFSSNYLMVVDADDCVSNKIAAFVNKNTSPNTIGWYIYMGYFYREGDKIITINRENFNTLCGTCIIIKPSHVKLIFKEKPHLLYVHQKTQFDDQNKLVRFPFPGAIYSMANGENHYMSGGQILRLNTGSTFFNFSTILGIFKKLRRYRIKVLNRKIINEFGIYSIPS